MIHRAGMTLLEMLLALVLLSTIVAATASWTQIAAALIGPDGHLQRQSWLHAANTVMDLIERDLLCGDSEIANSTARNAKRQSSRVTATENHLIIHTRPPGNSLHPAPGPAPGWSTAVHEYRLDTVTGQLQLIQQVGNASSTRPLIDHVQSFQCKADPDRQSLDVAIETLDGTLRRRYRLPPE